jgi:hypothetical protein
MLEVYSMYPHWMHAHVTKVDMLTFQDYFNKIIVPLYHWVKTITISVEHYLYFPYFCLKYKYREDKFNE